MNKALKVLWVFFSLWGGMNSSDGVASERLPQPYGLSHHEYSAYRMQILNHRLQADAHAVKIQKALKVDLFPSFETKGYGGAMLNGAVIGRFDLQEAEMVDDGGANTARMDMAVSPVTGNLLVVWQDERNSFDAPDIYGQIFDDGMNRIGNNFIIPQTYEDIAQLGPAVAAHPDGGFVVVWEDYRSGKPTIYMRYVGSSGSMTAEEVAVSEESSLFPDVACDTSGTVTVVWLSFAFDIYAIRGNRIPAGEAPTLPSFFVDDDLDGRIKGAPVVAAALNRNVIVAWEDQRDGNADIWVQRFDGGGGRYFGNLKVNVSGNGTIQWHPSISASQAGFALIWEDLEDNRGAIMLQRFDASMLMQEQNLRIDPPDTMIKSLPDVFLSPDGSAFVAWKQTLQLESTMMLSKVAPDNQTEIPIPFNGPNAKARPRIQVFDAHIKLGWMETGQDSYDHVYALQLATSVIPVELAEFQAFVAGCDVWLRWRTASESNNLGFEIQRKQLDQPFQTIGFRPGKGTTCDESSYSFCDRNLADGRYIYRLKQIDQDGSSFYSQEISVVITEPSTARLMSGYPNPFNAETVIEFSVPETEAANAEIAVFDIHGRRIRTLLQGSLASGPHRVIWNGLTDQNQPAATGVYFIAISGNGNRLLAKVTLVR